MSESWIKAAIVNRIMTTQRVVIFDLQPADGALLPEYEAGAHIDVLIETADAGSIVRQYSLCGPPGDRNQYRIAVLRDEQSRGGSIAMHQLGVGEHVQISVPRNHFHLVPARKHLLFAGGIGITPLLAMAQQLEATGGDYTLHFNARSASDVSFRDLLSGHPRVTMHLDDGDAAQKLDLVRDLGTPQADTAVYVCGPGPYIDYVLNGAAALGWPASALHKERFTPTGITAGASEGFVVRVASTGNEFQVGPDETVLDVLNRNGVEVPSSCQQGICGECVVKVLRGEADHRDEVLSDEEHEDGLFTTCCSRARSALIEIDLWTTNP